MYLARLDRDEGVDHHVELELMRLYTGGADEGPDRGDTGEIRSLHIKLLVVVSSWGRATVVTRALDACRMRERRKPTTAGNECSRRFATSQLQLPRPLPRPLPLLHST